MATQYTFNPRDLYGAFQVDAEEQFEAFYTRLAMLRGRTPTAEDWSELYRAIHTVKGGSAILGLESVTGLAEAICQALRRQRDRPDPSSRFWQTLEAAVQALEQITLAALAGTEANAERIAPHVEQLSSVS